MSVTRVRMTSRSSFSDESSATRLSPAAARERITSISRNKR
jgi:hypothetical protein